MAGVKISALPTQVAALLTDLLPVVQISDLSTKKVSLSEVLTLFEANSGVINAGLINELAWYAADGQTLSGLATANNGVLVTSAGGVPSISSTLPANLTIPTPIIDFINDPNSVHVLGIGSTASAVNYFTMTNQVTGQNPIFSSSGTDANIGQEFLAKGTGTFFFETTASSAAINFTTGTAYQHNTAFTFANTSASRTVTWPDADGTVAFASSSAGTFNGDSGSATPAAGVITFTGGTTGLTFSAAGSTLTLIGILAPKNGGTGINNGSSTITLGGSLTTSGAFASTFTMTGVTTVTFPTSGTLATTSALPTPAALTRVNDTNVTVTLGGTPSTALLQAVSLTLGWTGTLAVGRGGTGVGSVTTSPSATAFAGWDANSNLSANNFLTGFTSTASAAGTTTLTVASTQYQMITGSTTQNIQLPDATTLVNGTSYIINNRSTGALTIQNHTPATLLVLSANQVVKYTLIDNGAAAGTWVLGEATLVTAQQSFTAGSGNYTMSQGTAYIIVEMTGGGGGGGGIPLCNTAANATCSGSGGPGGYLKFMMQADQIAGPIAYTVGAGGGGGSAGANPGSAGGSTTFGSWTAAGGAGGAAGNAISGASALLSGARANSNSTSTGTVIFNIRCYSSQSTFHVTGTAIIFMLSQGGSNPLSFSYNLDGPYFGIGSTSGGGSFSGYNIPPGLGWGGNSIANWGTGQSATAGANGGNGAIYITEYLYT